MAAPDAPDVTPPRGTTRRGALEAVYTELDTVTEELRERERCGLPVEPEVTRRDELVAELDRWPCAGGCPKPAASGCDGLCEDCWAEQTLGDTDDDDEEAIAA